VLLWIITTQTSQLADQCQRSAFIQSSTAMLSGVPSCAI